MHTVAETVSRLDTNHNSQQYRQLAIKLTPRVVRIELQHTRTVAEFATKLELIHNTPQYSLLAINIITSTVHVELHHAHGCGNGNRAWIQQ
jgi:hypothetical protein